MEKRLEEPGFWDNPEVSQQVMKELKGLQDSVKEIEKLYTDYEDMMLLIEMSEEEDSEETAEEIGRITDRGVTSLEGMGTYTKSKRNVLLCACSKSEAYLVKNAVYQVDDSAFVMFTETSEVLGEGFKESLDEL